MDRLKRVTSIPSGRKKPRQHDLIEELLMAYNAFNVTCVKAVQDFEMETGQGACPEIHVSRGDVLRVTAFEDPDRESSGISQASGRAGISGPAWWLGYKTSAHRGLEAWFPNEFVTPMDYSKKTPLSQLLEDPLSHSLFDVFLLEETSEENLEFWRLASIFEYQHLRSSQSVLNEKVEGLMKQFIVYNAPRQINISSQTRSKLLKEAESIMALDENDVRFVQKHLEPTACQGQPHPAMFQEAVTEAYTIMQSDSYKRFQSTGIYDQFLKTRNPLMYK